MSHYFEVGIGLRKYVDQKDNRNTSDNDMQKCLASPFLLVNTNFCVFHKPLVSVTVKLLYHVSMLYSFCQNVDTQLLKIC